MDKKWKKLLLEKKKKKRKLRCLFLTATQFNFVHENSENGFQKSLGTDTRDLHNPSLCISEYIQDSCNTINSQCIKRYLDYGITLLATETKLLRTQHLEIQDTVLLKVASTCLIQNFSITSYHQHVTRYNSHCSCTSQLPEFSIV